jgi:ParB-like chromosome segregation protein Spo0J
MLALAHKIQQAIDRGVVRDRAEVARRLGLTRARVTQLLDLALLAPDIQDQLLFLESVDGQDAVAERQIREVVRNDTWAVQRMAFAQLSHAPTCIPDCVPACSH